MKKSFLVFVFFTGMTALLSQPTTLPANQSEAIAKLKEEIADTKEDSVKARLYYTLSSMTFRSNKKDAVDFAEQSLIYAKKTKIADLILKAYLVKANNQQRQGKYDDLLFTLKEAKPYLPKVKDNVQKGFYYSLTAQTYLRKGNYEKALQNYQKGLSAFEKSTTDPSNIGMTNFQIAVIHFRTGNADMAESYLLKADKIWQASEDWDRLEMCWRNLGSLYMKQGASAAAEKAFDKSVAYGKKSKKKPSPPRLKPSNNN